MIGIDYRKTSDEIFINSWIKTNSVIALNWSANTLLYRIHTTIIKNLTPRISGDYKKNINIISSSFHKTYIQNNLPRITLNMTAHCSHACWYCCSGKSILKPIESVIDKMGVERYLKKIILLSEEQRVEFRLVGGEPTEHPSFGKIFLTLLLAGHYVTVMTNGENVNVIKKIKDKITPEMKKSIHYEASFHIGAYLKGNNKKRMNYYINEVFPSLLETCSKYTMVIPLTPDVLKMDGLDEILDRFKIMADDRDVDLTFFLIELYGDFYKKSYPQDYSEDELERLVLLKKKYQDSIFDMGEIKAIQQNNDNLPLNGFLCYFMTRWIQVGLNGDIYICGFGDQKKIIGNIQNLTNPHHWIDRSSPCIFNACHCLRMAKEGCLQPQGIEFKEYISQLNENFVNKTRHKLLSSYFTLLKTFMQIK